MSDPTITLAGTSWPVPFLAPRQNRVVIPGLIGLGRRPDAQYDTLVDIVFAALTRAHPALAREDFDDWPIPTWELLAALPLIAKQTGFLRAARNPICAKAGTRSELPDWDALIAQFVNFLPGTTPDYWEDALTVPRLEAMREEWRRHPPLPLLAAAWLGYKPRPRDDEALEELMRLFPSGQLRVN
jgi:hypothetical protein